MIVIPSTYFGPIGTYASILQENCEMDEHENFVKQSDRSRCEIYGAGGRLNLVVPINHKGKRQKMKEVEISYQDNWPKLHLKSLSTAYRSSWYYEYFEDELLKVIQAKPKFLVDLNQRSLNFVEYCLNQKFSITKTDQYFDNQANIATDLRTISSTKSRTIPSDFPEYQQVFQNKKGFQANLSMLDLLFNQGPEAILYLKNLKNSSEFNTFMKTTLKT